MQNATHICDNAQPNMIRIYGGKIVSALLVVSVLCSARVTDKYSTDQFG